MNNQHGSTLLWALLMTVVIAGTASLLPGYFKQLTQISKATNVKTSALSLKENLMAILDNDAAWIQTIAANGPRMSCLSTNGASCAPDGLPISVYNGDGSPYLDPGSNAGFDLLGRPCVGFDAVTGHDSCVFQYVVTWVCDGGACPGTMIPPGFITAANPRILISGILKYAPRAGSPNEASLNVANYSFSFVRGSQSKTLSKYCASMGGLFNQQSSICQSIGAEPLSFECAQPYQWFVGYDATGTPYCMNDYKYNVLCPMGSAVIGYTDKGAFICGAF